MDEILASIRRIIETGEDRGGAGGGAPRAEPSRNPSLDAIRRNAEDVEPEANLSYFPMPVAPFAAPAGVPAETVDAHNEDGMGIGRAQASAATFEAPSTAHLVDEDHLTAQLETELAASWGDIGRDHDEAAFVTPHAAAGEVDPLPHHENGTAAAAADPFEPTESFARSPVEDRESDMSESARQEAAPERTTFEPANSDRRAAEANTGYDAFDAHGDPLTSASTGQMVSASFDELAQAIRKGELKSLEAMAQEMLKPMLSEWLDDNLPRMVERLVREEIERMARGGRR